MIRKQEDSTPGMKSGWTESESEGGPAKKIRFSDNEPEQNIKAEETILCHGNDKESENEKRVIIISK